MTDIEKRLLTAAVEQAQSARGESLGWSRQAIVDAMQAQLAAGHDPGRVAAVMISAASDPSTKFPGRIGHILAGAVTLGASSVSAPAAAPEWAQGSMKYLDDQVRRCRKPDHRGEPENGCGKCKADAIAALLNEPEPELRPEESQDLPPEARVTGLDLARKVAAAARSTMVSPRRHRFAPPPVPTTAPPSRAGSLFGAAAAVMGGAA